MRRSRYRLPQPIAFERSHVLEDHLFVALVTVAATTILVSLLMLAWTYQPTISTDVSYTTVNTQETQP